MLTSISSTASVCVCVNGLVSNKLHPERAPFPSAPNIQRSPPSPEPGAGSARAPRTPLTVPRRCAVTLATNPGEPPTHSAALLAIASTSSAAIFVRRYGERPPPRGGWLTLRPMGRRGVCGGRLATSNHGAPLPRRRKRRTESGRGERAFKGAAHLFKITTSQVFFPQTGPGVRKCRAGEKYCAPLSALVLYS